MMGRRTLKGKQTKYDLLPHGERSKHICSVYYDDIGLSFSVAYITWIIQNLRI